MREELDIFGQFAVEEGVVAELCYLKQITNYEMIAIISFNTYFVLYDYLIYGKIKIDELNNYVNIWTIDAKTEYSHMPEYFNKAVVADKVIVWGF